MTDDISRDLEQIADAIPAQPRGLAELRAMLQSLPAASPLYLPGTVPNELPTTDEQQQQLASGDATGSGTLGSGTAAPAGTTPGGAITPGTVGSVQIKAKAVDMTKFAQSIIPPRVVTALPTLPDPDWPPGSFAYLTTDKQLYKNVDNATWSVAADTDLLVNNLYAGSIAAGAIGTRELATVILLASLIKTADAGSRVEIDEDGIRSVDEDGNLVVDIPTDSTKPVFVAGSLVASGISMRGTLSEVSSDATLTAQANISNPASVPTLAQGWETIEIGNASEGPRRSFCYSDVGGAGGATKVFYASDYNTPSTIREWLASDGSLNRSLDASAVMYNFPISVAVHGGYLYLLGLNPSDGATLRVSRYSVATLAWNATYDAVSYPSSSGNVFSAIASDGTNLYIVQVGDLAHTVWNKYDSAMVKQGSTVDTGYAGPANARGLYVGNADFGAWRAVVVGSTSTNVAYVFDSTGAHQTNEDFPVPTQLCECFGITYGDAKGDGARFWTEGHYSDGYHYIITKHTPWAWTSGTNDKVWVGYTWYDSDGTTHETQISPRASVTMGKRKRLAVTTPSLPGGGGADDPNNRRIYAIHAASDPGATGLKLQLTTTLGTDYLTNYNGSGAADPSSNGFASLGATPGEIKSAVAGWALKGSGLMAFGGTSFPASPASGDHYYRTDIGLWFRYNGTRWLSVELFRVPLAGSFDAADSADSSNVNWVPQGLHGGSDLWIEKIAYMIRTATPLSGSAYWTVTVYKANTNSATLTSLDSHAQPGGTVDWHYFYESTVDALWGGSTYCAWRVSVTKTGTPGGVYWGAVAQYRVVAT